MGRKSRRIRRRVIAWTMAILMTVGLVPVDMLGGVLTAKAGAGNTVSLKLTEKKDKATDIELKTSDGKTGVFSAQGGYALSNGEYTNLKNVLVTQLTTDADAADANKNKKLTNNNITAYLPSNREYAVAITGGGIAIGAGESGGSASRYVNVLKVVVSEESDVTVSYVFKTDTITKNDKNITFSLYSELEDYTSGRVTVAKNADNKSLTDDVQAMSVGEKTVTFESVPAGTYYLGFSSDGGWITAVDIAPKSSSGDSEDSGDTSGDTTDEVVDYTGEYKFDFGGLESNTSKWGVDSSDNSSGINETFKDESSRVRKTKDGEKTIITMVPRNGKWYTVEDGICTGGQSQENTGGYFKIDIPEGYVGKLTVTFGSNDNKTQKTLFVTDGTITNNVNDGSVVTSQVTVDKDTLSFAKMEGGKTYYICTNDNLYIYDVTVSLSVPKEVTALQAPGVEDGVLKYDFASDGIFGSTEALASDTVLSKDGYVQLDKTTSDCNVKFHDKTHGMCFYADITFTVIVPAGLRGEFTLTGCEYSEATGADATVNGQSEGSVQLKKGETDGTQYTLSYTNTSDVEVKMEVAVRTSACAYLHNISYKLVDPDAKSWSAGKTGTVTIGDTTFDIVAGTSENTYTVTAKSGSGSVEIGDDTKSVVWADCGGNLSSSSVSSPDGSMTATVDESKVTLAFTDATTLPECYVLEVRDSGKASTPKKDGKTVTYSLTDGSILSELYKNTALAAGKSVKSEDGNFAVVSANGVKYNGTSYGATLNAENAISVVVAGNAEVTLKVAAFSDGAYAGIKASCASEGKVYLSTDESKSVADISSYNNKTVTFNYEGDATTLTFTFEGVTAYCSQVSVTNALPVIENEGTNDNLGYTLPYLENWTAGKLSVDVQGQKLTLKNSASQIVKTNIKSSGLGMYVFPRTSDKNTLSVDVVLKEGSSNNDAVMVGIFNQVDDTDAGIRAATVGLRGSNAIALLSSKKDTEVLGSSALSNFNAGDVVNITVTRDGTNLVFTYTNKTQGTAAATKSVTYSDGSLDKFGGAGGSVWYGIMVANASAVVTNMLYTDADGKVLYDQNGYYNPIGDVPTVNSVTAVAAEDRTGITVKWDADDAIYDCKYVVQVKKPGSDSWEDVATEVTEKSYVYKVSEGESGDFYFRVCGTKGNSTEQNLANRNGYVESEKAYIKGALEKPVLTVDMTSNGKVALSWTKSSGAGFYKVYRRSDTEDAASIIATVSQNSYTDSNVTDEGVYYYYVVAWATDNSNWSPSSVEKWTLVTGGHTGDYDEDVTLAITGRSYNTVFDNNIKLSGTAGAPGTVTVSVEGIEKASAQVSSGGTFSFEDIELNEGRNEVEVVLTYDGGKKVRKSLNYVYLTNYQRIVSADFDGNDGTVDSNGIPQYSTVQAAVNAASDEDVIFVRNGDYNEQLMVLRGNVSIIGEDSEKTRIYYSSCNDSKSGNGRYVVYVQKGSDNVTFENICIENTWAYVGKSGNESAEAIWSEADKLLLVGARLISYQDTLQTKGGSSSNKNNVYALRTYIAGNVDFMWGQNINVLFDDCDIVFRYNANKNAGYYTAYGENCNIIYNECRFTAEDSCGGSKYFLGRPYNANGGATGKAACNILYNNCYMGGTINKEMGYSTWSGNNNLTDYPDEFAIALYYECGSYGAGYAVNENRRQMSPDAASSKLEEIKGWDPYGLAEKLGKKYIGTIKTEASEGTVENEYVSTKYSWYDGDDTGLGKYELEGFAQSSGTSGGGLLKETNSNYYTVSTGDEFLAALSAARKSGSASVIEITADIDLGYNKVNASTYGSNIIQANNPALLNPVLKETGVSKVYIKEMSDLTIFSQNGATITHAAFDISLSNNIIIRNLTFDELWEWDEKTSGDYDVNDWDYMTVENGSTDIWIDHCTFYKAYDGIIDVKEGKKNGVDLQTDMNVTISWCEFLPGSKNNTFFNAMMDYLYENRDDMPYYKSLLDDGMTREQIWWYAYGQKKTHLLGQSDEASNNEHLYVTLANNYYYDSMDRMPRLRFGTAHIYNSILDAQELLDAKSTISNDDDARHIVSNGASSTCNGKLLMESCYINGIQNALNSGNGSSPSGYIAATGTLYYVNGIRYAAIPKVNTTKEGEQLKVTDANSFVSNLPYSGNYKLYDAAELDTVVKPYTGAGKLNLTVLQWEKASYNTEVDKSSEAKSYENDLLPGNQDSSTSSDDDDEDDKPETTVTVNDDGLVVVGESVGVVVPAGTIVRDMYGNIVSSGFVYIRAAKKSEEGRLRIEEAMAGNGMVFGEGVGVDYYEVTFVDANGNPLTFEGSLLVTFKFPEGTGMGGFSFKVMHLLKSGVLDVMDPTVTEAGVTVSVTEFSPFAVAYMQGEAGTTDGIVTTTTSANTGDKAPIVPLAILMVVCLGAAGTGAYVYRRKKHHRA